MPEARYENLSDAHPEWGQVAILPWDAEIFGFPVADYRAGKAPAVAQHRGDFSRCLYDWSVANHVELIGCSIPASDARWYTLLPALGFAYVDYTLKIVQNHMDKLDVGPRRGPVRHAQIEDKDSVERIAEHAFQAGRYYSDPRFPRELVNRRYKQWVGNVFTTLGPDSILLVTGEVGQATGFFYFTISGDSGYIQIIAVDLAHQKGTTAVEMISEVVRYCVGRGIHKISSKISALNSPVMNIATYFRMYLSDPQVVFHWHAPNAPHLESWESVYADPGKE